MTEKSSSLSFTNMADLLSAAVADLRECEARGIKVDMGDWLVIDNVTDKPCSVCVAGAMMAQRLEFDASNPLCTFGEQPGMTEICPDCFDDITTRQLKAVNQLRKGGITMGYANFYGLPMDYECDHNSGRGSLGRNYDRVSVSKGPRSVLPRR